VGRALASLRCPETSILPARSAWLQLDEIRREAVQSPSAP
jgi:hypothetical protein